MKRVQEILARIFKDLDELDVELEPYDAIIQAAHGKPLAECGASDRIKIAVAILKMNKMEVPYTFAKKKKGTS